MASPSVWLTAEGLAARGHAQGAQSRGKISLAIGPAIWENSVTTHEFGPFAGLSETRPWRFFDFWSGIPSQELIERANRAALSGYGA
jgi:hypothetical protein